LGQQTEGQEKKKREWETTERSLRQRQNVFPWRSERKRWTKGSVMRSGSKVKREDPGTWQRVGVVGKATLRVTANALLTT
jgi:hypothetical protein